MASQAVSSLEGHSLAGLCRSPQSTEWDGLSCAITAIESNTPASAADPAQANDQHFSVRSRTHRYLRYSNGEEELYDHRVDPFEWNNLSGDEGTRQIKKGLRDFLFQQVGLVNDE